MLRIKAILSLSYFFCLINSSCGQSIIDHYKNDLCEFSTIEEAEKSHGINVRMVYPCEWDISNNVRSGTLVQYLFIINDSTYITQNINISSVTHEMDWSIESFKKTREIFQKVHLEKGIKLKSFKQVSIDLLKSIECESSYISEYTIGKKYGHTIQYIIPYKHTSIAITFGVTASNIDSSNRLYELYLPLFKYIADKTVVLSQWK